MPSIRASYLPLPCQDAPESGRLILRDGSTAQLRLSRPDDRAALHAFFQGLSPTAVQHRFFSVSVPPTEQLATFCDSSDPR